MSPKTANLVIAEWIVYLFTYDVGQKKEAVPSAQNF